jgi:predicted kinase
MLISFGGLPGTGKTTVARALARRLGAVHVRLDTIEQAMRSCDVLKADVGPAGYAVAYGVAEDNLRIGRIVVADTVNPVQATRDAWLDVARRAAVRVREVEVICSRRASPPRRNPNSRYRRPPIADVARRRRTPLRELGTTACCRRHGSPRRQ